MKRSLLVAAAVVALAAMPALADDVTPPPWRGQWSTTLQYWEFGPANSGTADVLPDGPGPLKEGPPYEPGYLPSTKIIEIVPDPVNPDWIDLDPFGSVREGIWALSGHMDIIVDNHEPPNDYKLVWVQVTWHEGDTQHPDEPHFVNLDPTPINPPAIVDEFVWCNDWKTTVYEWRIEPNPPDEMFRLQGDILVDQLVIDTWCIPEPMTLGLLGLGGLAVLRRRRK